MRGDLPAVDISDLSDSSSNLRLHSDDTLAQLVHIPHRPHLVPTISAALKDFSRGSTSYAGSCNLSRAMQPDPACPVAGCMRLGHPTFAADVFDCVRHSTGLTQVSATKVASTGREGGEICMSLNQLVPCL